MRVVILILIFSILSCENSKDENAAWVKPDSITISCEEYYNVETKHGILTNNVWNKQAAKNDSWSQCLEKRLVDGDTQFGWSWSWPFGRKVIYSQPQIKIGASPWAPEPKFDSSFPLKISDLKRLVISHELEVSSNGDHNTATTMWLISEPYEGSAPNNSVIAAEVMIWTYSTDGHFSPAGRKLKEIAIDDTTWEVWHQKDWDDKSGVNKNKWVNVSFRAKNSSMKSSIPALELLLYAIRDGLIAQNLYVADVELGNEVMNGSGIAWVKEFDVLYEKRF